MRIVKRTKVPLRQARAIVEIVSRFNAVILEASYTNIVQKDDDFMRLTLLMLLIALLAACQSTATDSTSPPADLVVWERDPENIVFRADIVGGETELRARSRVPNCTIYGDNRIVYINELPNQEVQVLEDRATDASIAQFIQTLAFDELIYSFEAGLPTVQAEQPGANPVTEMLYINVNGLAHTADSLGGWDSRIFGDTLAHCKALSGAPVLVLPTAGWVSAREIPADTNAPLVNWNESFGVSLSEIAAQNGERVWHSGELITWLWETMRRVSSNTLYFENDRYYEVALEVPRVTRSSPPAPEG